MNTQPRDFQSRDVPPFNEAEAQGPGRETLPGEQRGEKHHGPYPAFFQLVPTAIFKTWRPFNYGATTKSTCFTSGSNAFASLSLALFPLVCPGSKDVLLLTIPVLLLLGQSRTIASIGRGEWLKNIGKQLVGTLFPYLC